MMHSKLFVALTILSCCCAWNEAKPFYGAGSSNDPYEMSGSSDSLEVVGAPAELNTGNNYNVIMPDYYDHNSAESIQYQNFEKFVDSQIVDSMEESQFLSSTPVREPQPLSASERRIRQKVEPVDIKREKKALQNLVPGESVPHGAGTSQWDQFDYDVYSANPGDDSKYTSG